MTESQLDPETLRGRIARELTGARQRTSQLTDCVDEADLVRQHSPLMSPLVWDLAHIANQEELWLLREVGGRSEPEPPSRSQSRKVTPGGAAQSCDPGSRTHMSSASSA